MHIHAVAQNNAYVQNEAEKLHKRRTSLVVAEKGKWTNSKFVDVDATMFSKRERERMVRSCGRFTYGFFASA